MAIEGSVSRAARRLDVSSSSLLVPIVLPARESAIRSALGALLGRAAVEPMIIAEVDDMAMLRLMARASGCPALVPPVVVVDGLKAGIVV